MGFQSILAGDNLSQGKDKINANFSSANYDILTLATDVTALTLDATTHWKKRIVVTAPAGCTITIPAGLESGWDTLIYRSTTAGLVTILSAGTIAGPGNTLEQAERSASIWHIGSNVHVLSGALGADPILYQYKALGIEYPTATEDVFLFFTDRQMTVSQVNDFVRGTTPSVSYNIVWGTTADATTVTSLFSADRAVTGTTGASTTTFANATIPAGSYVRLKTAAKTGTVTLLGVNLKTTL
jgi:hypothetical protein